MVARGQGAVNLLARPPLEARSLCLVDPPQPPRPQTCRVQGFILSEILGRVSMFLHNSPHTKAAFCTLCGNNMHSTSSGLEDRPPTPVPGGCYSVAFLGDL